MVDAIVVIFVGAEPRGVGLPVVDCSGRLGRHAQWLGKFRHAVDDGPRHLGLPAKRQVHVVVE